MTTAWRVPAVDISAWVHDGTADQRRRVATEIDEAARTIGFIQILGHQIPPDVIDGLARAMDGLFGQPLAVKNGYRTPPDVNRGYSPPKSESLSLSLGIQTATGMNDFFEAFNVGAPASAFPGLDLPRQHYPENLWPENLWPENLWPDNLRPAEPDDFQAAVSAYFVEAGRVARTLTAIFATALGLPAGYFEQFTDHSVDVLRMNNYALPEGAVRLDGDLTGMGAHTDYGIVTVLWADQVPGLQVLGSDREWHDVSPVDGALLVNLGDLTARWTNDRWLSTLHRVKPPIVDGAIRRRRSAAYFHDGNIDAEIATIASCLDADGRSAYEPITVGEHLSAKLAGSRAGQSNAAASREADRVRAAR